MVRCQQWEYPPTERTRRHRKEAEYRVRCREYAAATRELLHEETRLVCELCATTLIQMRPAPGMPTYWQCHIYDKV